MSGELRQYRVEGLITLSIKADYFQDDIPDSDVLENMVKARLEGSDDFKILNSRTQIINIQDMTR